MNIKYTDHLKLRLQLRKIPYNYPKLILENSDQKFFDNIEKKTIAIKKLIYNGSLRNIMIAYENKGDHIEIITIHPINKNQIINRIKSGRWKK
tara:strand:+ start:1931 stop:2209 length:279 start_codon:yes stop_codon:yes gene_type:complete